MIERRALTGDETFSLRRVAFHEAGHATVAAHFGVTGTIRLVPIHGGAGAPGFEFAGSFIPDRDMPDDHARCLYGLAGVAAEAIDGCWQSVADVLIGQMMSDADRQHAGEFTRRHVVEVIGLLNWNRGELELRANQAMQQWLIGPQSSPPELLAEGVDEA